MNAKRKVAALALATVMVGGGILLPQGVSAGADETPTYKKLYYFSDYAGSASYRNGVIASAATEYGLTSSDIVYNYWTDNFWTGVQLYNWGNIEDALVIFERRTGEVTMVNDGQTPLPPDYLETAFSTLDANGCKIMFIYGTAEERFSLPDVDENENKNKFLDYVDIHVNLDLFYNFIEQSISYAKNGGDTLTDCTFIFDRMLSAPLDNDEASGILNLYFLSYLKMIYWEDIQRESGDPQGFNDDEELLIWLGDEKHIHFLMEDDLGEYYDPIDETTIKPLVENGELTDFPGLTHNVYALGTSFGSRARMLAWLSDMKELQEVHAEKTPVFLYNPNNYSLGGYAGEDNSYGDKEIMTTGAGLSIFDTEESDVIPVLGDIMRDFILGEDLFSYDNYEGRCEVTHKPFIPGGGWMSLGGDGSGLACWQVSMEPDDYDYYL